MKGPVEIALARPDPPRERSWRRDDDDFVYDGDVGVLRIGRNLAAVDTTFSSSDEVTKRWLAEASTIARGRGRGRRLRAPLVAGLVALRGHDPSDPSWRPDFNPSDRDSPIRCVALCLGGSRALVYGPEALGCRDIRKGKAKHDGDRLKFLDNNMTQLRAFLDDKRITVACFGAREATRKLAREWGLHVALPEELTHLFALAFGKVEGVEAQKKTLNKPARYWMGKAALPRPRAMAKADRDDYDTDEEEEEATNLGKTPRPPKVVRGLSLERMARVALGPEMRLARCPLKVAQADWGNYHLGEEEWAYATRDAYLCFEIAARCLQKLGDPIGV